MSYAEGKGAAAATDTQVAATARSFPIAGTSLVAEDATMTNLKTLENGVSIPNDTPPTLGEQQRVQARLSQGVANWQRAGGKTGVVVVPGPVNTMRGGKPVASGSFRIGNNRRLTWVLWEDGTITIGVGDSRR